MFSVLRSDNRWTYALVADRTNKGIRFVVDDDGSTKTYSPEKWASCVRRLRALTKRKGLVENGKTRKWTDPALHNES